MCDVGNKVNSERSELLLIDGTAVSDDFKRMIYLAEEELRRAADTIGMEAIALMTASGNIFARAFVWEDYDACRRLLGSLDVPEVKKIVCIWKNGGFDLPSYEFRRMLLAKSAKNKDAEMLLFGGKYDDLGLFTKTVERTVETIELSLADAKRKTGSSLLDFAVDAAYKIIDGTPDYASVLKRQLGNAGIGEFRIYKQGFSVSFMIAESSPRLNVTETLTLGDTLAEIPGLEHGMGFILWVKHGIIDSLEGYTYGEDIPDSLCGYTLQQPETERK